MALGFRWAGIEFDIAVDAEPVHCDTYEANLGHRPLCMDVCELLELVRVGWRPAEPLELVVADPPCFPVGTKITTIDGDVPIEQVTVGDLVMTHAGRWRAVRETFVREVDEYLLQIDLGYRPFPVQCTSGHPLYVRRGNVEHWVRAVEIRAGDQVLMPFDRAPPPPPRIEVRTRVAVRDRGNGLGGSPITSRAEIRTRPCNIDLSRPEVAWLIGLYLAEGHRRGRDADVSRRGMTRREVIFSVATDERRDVVERVDAAGAHAIVGAHGNSVVRVVADGRRRAGIVDEDGAWIPVESVHIGDREARVVNLSVEDDESYVADGIAAHNCTPWSRAGLRRGTDDERDSRSPPGGGTLR